MANSKNTAVSAPEVPVPRATSSAVKDDPKAKQQIEVTPLSLFDYAKVVAAVLKATEKSEDVDWDSIAASMRGKESRDAERVRAFYEREMQVVVEAESTMKWPVVSVTWDEEKEMYTFRRQKENTNGLVGFSHNRYIVHFRDELVAILNLEKEKAKKNVPAAKTTSDSTLKKRERPVSEGQVVATSQPQSKRHQPAQTAMEKTATWRNDMAAACAGQGAFLETVASMGLALTESFKGMVEIAKCTQANKDKYMDLLESSVEKAAAEDALLDDARHRVDCEKSLTLTGKAAMKALLRNDTDIARDYVDLKTVAARQAFCKFELEQAYKPADVPSFFSEA